MSKKKAMPKSFNVIVRDPNKHARERHAKLYGIRNMQVDEDLRSELARKTWPRYKVFPDGRQGPLAFETLSEKKEYCRRYGFEEG